MAFDVIFVGLVVRLLVVEILDIRHHFKHRHPGSGFRWLVHYLTWWNFVDWVSIVYTMTLIIMWCQVMLKIKGLEKEVFTASVAETSHNRSFSELLDFQDQLNDLNDHFKDVYDYQHIFRILASLFPVCLMLRLFKAFAAQPRLALVTRTIHISVVDVCHFLVVFFTIFTTFVVMSIALFGREMEEFSTFERAFNNCFLTLLGDFDYHSLFAEARGMGSLWFWLFQIVLGLLMLNMLLAIIMDTYTVVKGKSKNSETIFEQLFVLIRRWHWIRSGEGLSLEDIDCKLSEVFGKSWKHDMKKVSIGFKFDPADILTIEGFASLIEGLEIAQATFLVTNAIRNWRLEHSDPLTLTEAANVISLIHLNLENQSRMLAQNHQQLVQGLRIDQDRDRCEIVQGASETDQTGSLDSVLKTTNARLDAMDTKLDTIVKAQDHDRHERLKGGSESNEMGSLESTLKTTNAKSHAMDAKLGGERSNGVSETDRIGNLESALTMTNAKLDAMEAKLDTVVEALKMLTAPRSVGQALLCPSPR